MALDFDGVNDVSDHGNITAFNTATVLTTAFWLISDALDTSDAFIDKSTPATADTVVTIGCQAGDSSKFYWSTRSGGVDPEGATATGAVVVGETRHWVSVYNGAGAANADRLKIYRDGIEQTLTFSGTIPASLASNTATVKVARNARSSKFADCKLSCLKIWTAALTQAEILQEMNSFRPARTANLILWAPYDDGTSARDYSGNGNHGTVTEAVQVAGPPVSYGARVIKLQIVS